MYEDRIVAFVDLLGFKNAVRESVYDPDIRRRIKAVFDILSNEYEHTYKADEDTDSLAKLIGKEMTFFSDCVVISYDQRAIGGIFYTLLDIIHLCLDFSYNGFLLRGGVVCGQITHEKNICYGPAMNNAYLIESEIAKNPLIRIDNSIFINAEKYKAKHHTILQEYEHIFNLLKTDHKTGAYYIDYLAQSSECDSWNSYLNYLHKIKKDMEYNLWKYRDNPRIYSKYEWYKTYYNDTIKQVIHPSIHNEFLIK